MIDLTIPVHEYVKLLLPRYMDNNIADHNSIPGKIIIELLEDNSNKKRVEYAGYDCTVTLKASTDIMTRKINNTYTVRESYTFNETQAIRFNTLIGKMVRIEIRSRITTYLEFDKSLKRAIDFVRRSMNLPMYCYSDDAIIKDFQRFREKMKDAGDIYFLYKTKSSDEMSFLQ